MPPALGPSARAWIDHRFLEDRFGLHDSGYCGSSVITEDIEASTKKDSSGKHEPTLSIAYRGNSLLPSSSKTSAAEEDRTAQHVEGSTTEHIERTFPPRYLDTKFFVGMHSDPWSPEIALSNTRPASQAGYERACSRGSSPSVQTPSQDRLSMSEARSQCTPISSQETGTGRMGDSMMTMVADPAIERDLLDAKKTDYHSWGSGHGLDSPNDPQAYRNHASDTTLNESQRSALCESSNSVTLAPKAASVVAQAPISLHTGSAEQPATPCIPDQLTGKGSRPLSPSNSTPQLEGNLTTSSSDEDQALSAQGGIMQWVNASNDTVLVQSTSSLVRSATMSVSGSSAVQMQDLVPGIANPGREQGPSTLEISPSIPLPAQMPCPLLYSSRCQGTNPTISELLRSLQNRHRIVICVTCCEKLKIPDEEKKAENVLKKHVSEGCEPRCIGSACSDFIENAPSHHRRTETCPSWKALTNELKWTYIWTLVNPGLPPPNPEFLVGVGFEHTLEKRPNKQKQRARVNDIGTKILLDLEARERRISELENSLEASNDRNIQLQERCDKKANDLENIIQTLLECLTENHVRIRPSLQNRLRSECPRIATAISDASTPAHPQIPYILGPTLRGQKGGLPAAFPTMQGDIQQLSEKSLQGYPNINPILSSQPLPSSLETFQDAPSHQTSGMWDETYGFLNLDSENA